MSTQKYPQSTSVSSSSGTVNRNVGKRKTNGYSNYRLHAKNDQKRKDAEARQAKYDGMTIAEKFSTLIADGSKKQRNKLENQLAKEAAKTAPKATATVTVTNLDKPKSQVVAEAKTKRPAKS